MRAHRNALLLVVTAAVLCAAPIGTAFAQTKYRGGDGTGMRMPSRGSDGGGYHGGRGMGGLGIVPGILLSIPQVTQPQAPVANTNQPSPRRQQPRRNAGNAAPPANAPMVPDEVVIEVPNSISPAAVNALERRHRLTRLESLQVQLTGTTFFRWQIPDRRSVPTVVRALQGDRVVASAQPNYLFALQQQTEAKAASDVKPAAQLSEGDPAQYELAKLHLPQAHGVAKGDNVLVAVIDSGVDVTHPELAGAIAGTFDTLKPPMQPHSHGTAIAGLIAAHARLMGSAPAARILAARAFDPVGGTAEGTTFNILKALDWAAANNARVINMSFAGPSDPAIHRSIEAAFKKGIVLVAAAGNDGPKSPPLFPAADPEVIAVTATDAEDKLFAQSNRGRHIAVAAPGSEILVAAPDASYQVQSGTSFSAAEVSGIVALMLQRKPDLTPTAVRAILLATAKDLGPNGRDDDFGAGLADAFRAVTDDAPAAKVAVEEKPEVKPARKKRVTGEAR